MAIVKTHLYNLSFDSSDLMKVLLTMQTLKENVFPVDSKKIVNKVKGVSVMEGPNPYLEAKTSLEELAKELSIDLQVGDYHGQEIDLESIHQLIDHCHSEFETMFNIKNNIEMEYQENKEAILLLNNLKDLHLSIDELENTSFIQLRFGRIPLSQVEKLKYYKDYRFICQKLNVTEHHVWLLYCGLTSNIGEIDNIFKSMGFKEVILPEFAHGESVHAIQELENEAVGMENYIQEVDEKIRTLGEVYKKEILSDYTIVYHLKELYDQCQYVVDLMNKNAIYAFSSLDIEHIKSIFQDIETMQIYELPVNIYEDRGIVSPILVKNNRFVAPFEQMLSHQLSDTFDPTTCVAIALMLTAMLLLGDMGVGIIVLGFGLLLSLKTKGNFPKILKRLGCAIFIGGLLSGGCFYTTILYNPIFTFQFDRIHHFMFFVAINVIVCVILILIKKVTRKTIEI